MIFSKYCGFILVEICHKNQYLRSEVSEHVGEVKQFLPFTHPDSFEKNSFFKETCIKTLLKERLNSCIARNFSDDLWRVVQFFSKQGRVYFNSFRVELNVVGPCSSEFGVSEVNKFKSFPYFLRHKCIVHVLNEFGSQNLQKLSLQLLVKHFQGFGANVWVNQVVILQLRRSFNHLFILMFNLESYQTFCHKLIFGFYRMVSFQILLGFHRLKGFHRIVWIFQTCINLYTLRGERIRLPKFKPFKINDIADVFILSLVINFVPEIKILH